MLMFSSWKDLKERNSKIWYLCPRIQSSFMSGPTKRVLEDSSESSLEIKRRNKSIPHGRECTTVVVYHLPNNYNYHKVKKYFKSCGNINRIDLVDVEDKSSKTARIEFDSPEGFLSAQTKNYKKIKDKEIEVRPLQGCTIWITNFPPGSDSEKLKTYISERVNLPILSIRLPSLTFNSKRRFAYVDFVSPAAAQEAVSILNDQIIEKFRIVAKISNPGERTPRSDEAILQGREIIVKNLNQDTITKEDLVKLFGTFGELERVTIPLGNRISDSTQVKSCYAFVSFKNLESAKLALSLNKTEFQNNVILVSRANRKSYLERQEVKRILASKRGNEHIIGIFPIDSSTSAEEVRALIRSESTLPDTKLVKILLVSDHEGALIVCDNPTSAAVLCLALNGKKLNGSQIHCGSVHDLTVHKQLPGLPTLGINTKKQVQKVERFEDSDNFGENGKFSNDDFRKMFLSK